LEKEINNFPQNWKNTREFSPPDRLGPHPQSLKKALTPNSHYDNQVELFACGLYKNESATIL
jgi:hypothetical protein